MKQKLSSQTSSFIILTTMAFVGGLFVIFSSQSMKNHTIPYGSESTNNGAPNPVSTAYAAEATPVPDISDWQTQNLEDYTLSFKTPKTWKVKPLKTADGYKVVEIDPGKKFFNIKIYISENSYYVMEGLPAVTTTITGKPALNVSNLLYGLNQNGTYFTFDLGPSLSLIPEFNAMVKSVVFK